MKNELTEIEREWLCRDSETQPDPRGPQCDAEIRRSLDSETFYCCIMVAEHPGQHVDLRGVRW